MDNLGGTFQRTILKFLSECEPDVLIASVYNGKMLSGHASKHRTRSGVRYNKLMTMWKRSHPVKVEEKAWDPADDMCPNCVTPWKCNGPHIPQTGV